MSAFIVPYVVVTISFNKEWYVVDVTQITNYKALIITGIISLAVAVGGNLVVNWLSEEKLSLTYDLVSSESFASSNSHIKITTLTLSNEGTKSVDEVVLSLKMNSGVISEYKIFNIPANLYTIKEDSKQLVLQVKYLNAGDHFSIQMLTHSDDQKEFLPSVDLRGRGVIGKPSKVKESNSFLESVLLAMAAIAAFVSVLSMWSNKKVNSLLESSRFDLENGKHRGDQRDIFAYVLSINGLLSEAKLVREFPRKIHYWSIADLLTEEWIGSGDKTVQEKGIKVLTDLIDYAAINGQSIRLVQTNIIRLETKLGKQRSDAAVALEEGKNSEIYINHRLNKLRSPQEDT